MRKNAAAFSIGKKLVEFSRVGGEKIEKVGAKRVQSPIYQQHSPDGTLGWGH
jgi:hypothetical protein